MNVLSTPKWLIRPADPAVPPLPASRPEEMREAASKFMNDFDRLREENAYLRSENGQLLGNLRLEKEKTRMLEDELTHVRNERDWLTRHDASMLATLDDVEALIVARKKRARADAYAPPASGQQDITERADELAEGVAELAQKLAPEQPTNA